MRVKFLAALAVVMSLLHANAVPAASAPVDESYTLLPGDVVEIAVWQEETLTKQVLVRPDGGLSFPLAGNVQAKGRTVGEVTDDLRKKIAKFIPDPVVTVSLVQNAGNRIYVLGRVNKPGDFQVPRQVDVMQALSMAGGLTPFAERKGIRVLRRGADGQQVLPFNYEQVERGEALDQNILLEAGDVVMVP